MFRRSLQQLAGKSTNKPRKVVRDPRKIKKKRMEEQNHLTKVISTTDSYGDSNIENYPVKSQLTTNTPPAHPFQSMAQNNDQQSFGSSLGTYVILGVGVTMGVTLVRLVIG